jgi:hypothetical protein
VRAAKVARVTNASAPVVSSGCTSAPWRISSRASSAAL